MTSLQIFTRKKQAREPLSMISLYDAPSAALCCDAGVDALLVGDSMGNVVLGYDNTLPVTMEEMLVHARAVARGARASQRPEVPIVVDLPFGSYATEADAAHHGAALLRAGAHALKLEGAGPGALAAARLLAEMGAPVMGHLGYTPQSSLRFARVVQGANQLEAARLRDEAHALQEAGCFAIVLEVVPMEVAARITSELEIATVGIGAGAGCDGQVLVWHDLAGLTPQNSFRFVRRYAEAHGVLCEAARQFINEVQSGAFPTAEHGWKMPEEA
jgi:3-methyl-2-oxobutanoate hydroxymethyltransferase